MGVKYFVLLVLNLIVGNATAGISADALFAHVHKFEDLFGDDVRIDSGRNLKVYFDEKVNSSTVNLLKKETEWQIKVYGGLIEQEYLGSDHLDLILCHELGHILGGKPHGYVLIKDSDGKKKRVKGTSFEGQADYFAASVCLKKLWGDGSDKRILAAAFDYASHLEKNVIVSFETPAPARLIPTTLERHPPPQCRLDTFLAGVLGRERPKCWFWNDEP